MNAQASADAAEYKAGFDKAILDNEGQQARLDKVRPQSCRSPLPVDSTGLRQGLMSDLLFVLYVSLHFPRP